jgi:Leucine-rich repeat (LRR) protein
MINYTQIAAFRALQRGDALPDDWQAKWDSETTLNLEGNDITSLDGVTFPATLTTLNLDGNDIASLDGVTFPATLTTLNLSFNKITSLDGVTFPATLTTLYLGYNKIADWSPIAHLTKTTVYGKGNLS